MRRARKIYPVIALICTTAFVVDPLCYAPYEVPELMLLVAIPLATVIIVSLYVIARRRTVMIAVSIIELLMIAELIWMVHGNPLLLIHTEDLHFFSLVALIVVALIARQLHAGQEETNEARQPAELTSAIRLLIRTIWIIGVCQALIGFAQYYTIFSWLPIGSGKTRMIGLVGAANGFGTVMALAVMALVIEAVVTRRFKFRIAFLALAGVPFCALVLNGCRGALLALVAAAIAFVVATKQSKINTSTATDTALSPSIKRRTLGGWHLILAMAILILFGGLSSYLYFYDFQSSLGRIFVWRVSAPMFLEHPVRGIGAGNYSVDYLDYQKQFFENPANLPLAFKAANMKQALSDYVQAFCETGLVGGLLFLAILGIALWGFFRKMFDPMLLGAGSLFLVILIHMAVDTPLRIVLIASVMACLLGLAPAPTKLTWHFRVRPIILAAAFLLPLLVLSVFVGYKCDRYYQGHISWLRGYEYARQHRWQFASQEYKRALVDMPHDGQLLFNLGGVQIIEGSYSDGIYHLQKARSSFNDRNIYLSLSEGYLGLHEYARAERYALIALGMFPNQISPHLLLGEIYYKLGKFKKSKAALRMCIDGDTSIRSNEVERLGTAAKHLWNVYYGKKTDRG